MSNLITRTLTGIGFIVVIVAGITINKYTFLAVFLLIAIAGLIEFYNLIRKANIFPQYITGIISAVFIFVSTFLYYDNVVNDYIFYFSLPAGLLIILLEIFRKKEKPIENIATTIFGILYVMLPFAFFNFFVFNPSTISYNADILLGFFIMQWISDTGAYVVGMPFGKHKLIPRISPNKSWEGFVGSLILTTASGHIMHLLFGNIPLIHWMVIGLLIAFFGTMGDLLESKLKRNVGVKDSSKLLPGHGGILDRFDSVLLSSPIVFAYLQVIL